MLRDTLHVETGSLRRIWSAVILLWVIPAISGCTPALQPAEPVAITFACPTPEKERYQALIQEFNEDYPHITVELDDSGAQDPDVFFISPFDLSDQLEEDAVLRMDPFVEQDSSFDLLDFYPGTVELFTREGKLWAVPAALDMIVLYYNSDLFDAYGAAYPQPGWTWDDFLDAALILRDPEADVFGYAPMDEFLDPLPFIYQHGGGILDDMQSPTRTTFDDPLTIEALEWYAALIHEHNVVPRRNQLYDLDGSVESGVYLGRVAMWTGWLFEQGGRGEVEDRWPAAWKFRWGMVPLPRDARSATPAFVLGYAISSRTTQPEACWQWISFLSQQVQIPFGMAPARRSIAGSPAYEQLVGRGVVDVARESMEGALLLSPSLVEFVNPWIYGSAVDAIVEGRSTPLEAMTRAQQQATQQ